MYSTKRSTMPTRLTKLIWFGMQSGSATFHGSGHGNGMRAVTRLRAREDGKGKEEVFFHVNVPCSTFYGPYAAGKAKDEYEMLLHDMHMPLADIEIRLGTKPSKRRNSYLKFLLRYRPGCPVQLMSATSNG